MSGKIFHKTPFPVAVDQIAHHDDIMKARVVFKDEMGITATHPAYFDSKQKYFTLKAGMLPCSFTCSFMLIFTFCNFSVIAFLRKSSFLPFVLLNVNVFVIGNINQQKLQGL